jgi:hypothetical protein
MKEFLTQYGIAWGVTVFWLIVFGITFFIEKKKLQTLNKRYGNKNKRNN